MPCRDYEDRPNYEADELRKRNDELARFACVFATTLETLAAKRRIPEDELFELVAQTSPKYAPAALTWWKKHKVADAAEQARVAKKAALKKTGQAVMNKLTDEEREALREYGVDIPLRPAATKRAVAVKKAK